MMLEKMIKNKTYTYIYPMLSKTIATVKDHLLNAFIGDIDHPEMDEHIFLLYEFQNTEKFLKYEAYLKEHEACIKNYDPTTETVMFVFDIPKDYINIYKLFKRGKYSRFPRDYKLHICAFHNIENGAHKIVQVLNKDERLYLELEERLDSPVSRDVDPSSIPDLEIEVFNKNYL